MRAMKSAYGAPKSMPIGCRPASRALSKTERWGCRCPGGGRSWSARGSSVTVLIAASSLLSHEFVDGLCGFTQARPDCGLAEDDRTRPGIAEALPDLDGIGDVRHLDHPIRFLSERPVR